MSFLSVGLPKPFVYEPAHYRMAKPKHIPTQWIKELSEFIVVAYLSDGVPEFRPIESPPDNSG